MPDAAKVRAIRDHNEHPPVTIVEHEPTVTEQLSKMLDVLERIDGKLALIIITAQTTSAKVASSRIFRFLAPPKR